MNELERILARTAVIGGIEGPRQMSRADYEVLTDLAQKALLGTGPLLEGRLRAEGAVRDLLVALEAVRNERDRLLEENRALVSQLVRTRAPEDRP